MSIMLDGPKVKRLRENAGLTIDSLSKQMGVSRWTVSRTERSLTGMSVSNAAKLAECLGVSLKSLRKEG